MDISDKFWDIVKKSNAYKLLNGDVENDCTSHAYLLCSKDGLALSILSALFIGQAIARENDEFFAKKNGEQLYGEQIARQILKRSSPDIAFLPQDGDSEKVVTEDVDFLTENAFITPTELKKKYFVIDKGETMNETCQNKLLKTLEEPPPSCRIIIKCANKNRMLKTVLSRCRIVDLSEFNNDDIKAELIKYHANNDLIDVAAALSRGLISEAERILEDKESKRLFDDVSSMLVSMQKSSDIVFWAAKLNKSRERSKEVIDYVELLLFDAAAYQNGGKRSMNFTEYDSVPLIAAQYNTESILNILPYLKEAKRALDYYGNPVAVMDKLLYDFLSEKTKSKKM